MIQNKIEKLIYINWREELHDLQPKNVKLNFNSDALKNSLKANGFILPFAVWKDAKGCYYCVDGHTRKKVLNELVDEGVEVPATLPATLPAFIVKASNKKEAIKVLVEVFNQKQNLFDESVLMEWVSVEGFEADDLNLDFVNIVPVIHNEEDIDLDDFFTDHPHDHEKKFKFVLEYPEDKFKELETFFKGIKESKEDFIYNLIKQ